MSNTLRRLLTATTILGVTGLIATACCGGDLRNADDELRVEYPGPDGAALCEADVVAFDADGAQVPLEEIALESGCAYRATVDPRQVYRIEATHPEHGAAIDEGAVSNPSCSSVTDPDDIDASVFRVATDDLSAVAARRDGVRM